MQDSIDERDRFRGCLLGLAAGDAVGTTLEFTPPSAVRPISDMLGGGPFDLKPGEWTDDTSMALCLATSLVECGEFDPRDQMDRYCNWAEAGYLSSNGECFDIGMTVARSLAAYRSSGEPFSGPTEPTAAGNGSIMRLAPVALYYYPDEERAVRYAAESSRTTHGAAECLDACALLAEFLMRALRGAPRGQVLAPVRRRLATPALEEIGSARFLGKARSQIRGSGYVVQSLEAALWCFSETDSFRDAVLLAANLGEDADTTAAVCGQLAGAHYGVDGIPKSWLDKLALREQISGLADRLFEVGCQQIAPADRSPAGPSSPW